MGFLHLYSRKMLKKVQTLVICYNLITLQKLNSIENTMQRTVTISLFINRFNRFAKNSFERTKNIKRDALRFLETGELEEKPDKKKIAEELKKKLKAFERGEGATESACV